MAELINIDIDFKYAVNKAVEIFRSCGLFVYPTDTIYGFGCNPFNDSSMKTLNKIKGRSKEKKYILLISDIKSLFNYISLNDERVIVFLNRIWPNPISVVLNLNEKTKSLYKNDSAAFRITDNEFCVSLLKKIKLPLVSTSVNRSNSLALKEYSSIVKKFGNSVEAVFYTEKLRGKEASTLVDLRDNYPKILRYGKINIIELWEKLN